MATELRVPTLGMDMEEATIVRWLVEEGAEVEKGDPVLEIDTDKTSFEIEAPAGGVIRGLRGGEGETLAVGTTLAYVTAPGEEIPEPEGEPPDATADAEPEATSDAKASETPERPPAPASADSEDGRKVRASPAARRAASEMGVPIENISGSGPYGRVYLSDILEMEREETAAEPPSPEPIV